MQTVSDAVKRLVDSYGKVTLAVYIDGEKLDVGVGAGSYSGACAGEDEFSFGNACAAGANVTLVVSRPDLKGHRIQITWAVEGTEHPLLTGQVEKARVTAGRTEIEAWDDMYFAGSKAFCVTDAVTGDCTASTAFAAVADAMGVSADATALSLLSDLAIPGGLSGLGGDVTNSAVAGYIAGLVGGNALMSRAGLLTIQQYTASDWETEPYSGGASADNEEFAITGITLQREIAVVTLNDDGSTTERTVTEEYTAGDGSLLINNPLASQEAADTAYAALSAVTVRPGNYSFPGGLLLEPGDIFTIHSMDGSYAVAVGSISMTFDGGVKSSVACGGAAEGAEGNRGSINQALEALLADYAKFKKLVADNVEINSANVLNLIAGDILADRIKAGVIQSADGGVKIDLNKGYGNLARSQTVWLDGFDAYAMPIGITEQLKDFLTEKARKLREAVDVQNGRAQDYTIRVGTVTDEEGYPNFGEVTMQVFRSPAGPIRAGVSFEWWNGNISHMTGEDEAEDGNWVWSDMKWITGDFIVEQGTSGIWTYRKWNSGKIELWTNSYQFTVTFTKSSIGVYYATESGIPVPLVKTIEFASGDCTKWHYVNWSSVTCNGGTELGIRYYGLNANGGGNTIPFSFYVIGTWK